MSGCQNLYSNVGFKFYKILTLSKQLQHLWLQAIQHAEWTEDTIENACVEFAILLCEVPLYKLASCYTLSNMHFHYQSALTVYLRPHFLQIVKKFMFIPNEVSTN